MDISYLKEKYAEYFIDSSKTKNKQGNCFYLYLKKYDLILCLIFENILFDKLNKVSHIIVFDKEKNIYKITNNNIELYNDEMINVLGQPCLYGKENILYVFRKLFGQIIFAEFGTPFKIIKLNDILYIYNKRELDFDVSLKKDIDGLNSYSLKKYSYNDFTMDDGNIKGNRILVKNGYDGYEFNGSTVKQCGKIEVVNSELLAMRVFLISEIDCNIYEQYRIYITSNSLINCVNNIHYGFIPVIDIHQREFIYYDNDEFDNSFIGTRIWYFKDLISDSNFDKSSGFSFIYNIFKKDIYEKLYKIGFKLFIIKDAKGIINQSVSYFIKDNFHYFDNNASNIFLKLGLNEHQCAAINYYNNLIEMTRINNLKDKDEFYYSDYSFDLLSTVIAATRNMIANNLNPIDNDSFDYFFESLLKIFVDNYEYVKTMSCCELPKIVSMLKTLGKSTIQVLETINAIFKYELDYYIITDYFKMIIKIKEYAGLNFNINYDYIFHNDDELTKAHDDILKIYDEIVEEKSCEKFDELVKKWEKYTYENDIFSILYPKSTKDFLMEGQTLHHCVKSYIDSVLEEKTNIFFLRKKSDIEKPFFTVEVTDKNVIRQIHGFGNCNLEVDSEEYSFVIEWASKKQLEFGDINKILGIR